MRGLVLRRVMADRAALAAAAASTAALRHASGRGRADSQMCVHGNPADDCRECGTQALCPHNIPRRRCLQCNTPGGADGSECPHGYSSKMYCEMCRAAMPKGG